MVCPYDWTTLCLVPAWPRRRNSSIQWSTLLAFWIDSCRTDCCSDWPPCPGAARSVSEDGQLTSVRFRPECGHAPAERWHCGADFRSIRWDEQTVGDGWSDWFPVRWRLEDLKFIENHIVYEFDLIIFIWLFLKKAQYSHYSKNNNKSPPKCLWLQWVSLVR